MPLTPPNFEKAVSTVLQHEGGFVNDADDPGGATNYGISLRYLVQHAPDDLKDLIDTDGDGEIEVDEIRNMSEEAAKRIYRQDWWDKFKYEELCDHDIAAKVFDLAVNMGSKQAHKLLQRACRASGKFLVDDGIIGPNTRTVAKKLIRANQPAVLAGLRSEAAGFYRSLIAAKPKFKKYEKGWLLRAYS